MAAVSTPPSTPADSADRHAPHGREEVGPSARTSHDVDGATVVDPLGLPEAQGTGGADAVEPATVPVSGAPSVAAGDDDAPRDGLTDQTNFLPTRQVITVFLGLSVGLACSFLDQTM
jgi:hypothetical protein